MSAICAGGQAGFQSLQGRRTAERQFGAFCLWRLKTVSPECGEGVAGDSVRMRQRLVCMQEVREELGHDGQLGTVDRELLHCWCAPQMEDAMCYTRDYKVFDDQKKAEDTQVVQERRAGLIDRLLDAANKHGEKSKAEGTPVKEVAPAK